MNLFMILFAIAAGLAVQHKEWGVFTVSILLFFGEAYEVFLQRKFKR